MQFYTTLTHEMFMIITRSLSKLELNYISGQKPFLPLEDQLLVTLMKLKLNLKELDLAYRFCVSKGVISDIFYTVICALHIVFANGTLDIPKQLKRKPYAHKALEVFSKSTMNPILITADTSQNLDEPSLSSSNCERSSEATVSTSSSSADSILSPWFVDFVKQEYDTVNNSKEGDDIVTDKDVSSQQSPFLNSMSVFTTQESNLHCKIVRSWCHMKMVEKRVEEFEFLKHIPACYEPIATQINQVCCVLLSLQAV